MCDHTTGAKPTAWLSCHPCQHPLDTHSAPAQGTEKSAPSEALEPGQDPEKHRAKEGVHTVEGDEFWVARMSGANLQRERPRHTLPTPPWHLQVAIVHGCGEWKRR